MKTNQKGCQQEKRPYKIPRTISKTINAFKFYRERKGVSQEKMAEIMGCSLQQVKNIEWGTASHRAYWMRKRAIDFFGVEDRELFPEKTNI